MNEIIEIRWQTRKHVGSKNQLIRNILRIDRCRIMSLRQMCAPHHYDSVSIQRYITIATTRIDKILAFEFSMSWQYQIDWWRELRFHVFYGILFTANDRRFELWTVPSISIGLTIEWAENKFNIPLESKFYTIDTFGSVSTNSYSLTFRINDVTI